MAFLVYFLQLYNDPALFSVWVLHVWIEEATDLLVIVLETLQYKELRNDEEDFSISLLELVRKLLVLLRRRLYYLAEVQQLVERFAVQEVSQALTPTVLEFNQDFD